MKTPFSFGQFLIFSLSILLISSCGKAPEKQTPRQVEVEVDLAEIKGRAHPRVLDYAPSFRLQDQTGSSFSSEALADKPWVANFIFTRCPATCPRQTALLKTLQDQLAQDQELGQVHLLSFTVDPGHDTPEVLKNYAEEAGADESIWKFLTGSEKQIRDTVSRQGFKLAVEADPDDPSSITHSPYFILVDAYQRVRGLYDTGEATVLGELISDLKALQAEVVMVPGDADNPEWLSARAQKQRASASTLEAFHDFTFTDRREESGIRFRHKIVDESGKQFKGVHYDHGSGVAVADVDGDDLLDLYFVNQVGSNELWRNLGGGKFENITERAGVFVSDRVGVAASFADIDNDGDPDLFVTAVRKGNILFENLGGGRFRNITAGSGLAFKGHSSGAIFFDYDRDGLLDLLVANVGQYTKEETTRVTMESIRGEAETGDLYHVGFADAFGGHLKTERSETSRLYRNLGDRKFEDVSEPLGLLDSGWHGDAAPVDLNNDGWTDLYMLNMQGDDSVYFNREGKKFETASPSLFPKTPWGSMGVKAFDFENDGDLDLYITDMHSDMSEHIGPEEEKEKARMQWTPSFLKTEGSSIFGNAFFRKREDGSYEEISGAIGAENYWPWGLSVDDFNADGFDDVFITASMNFPLRYGINSLLLNEGGRTFRDAEFLLGVEPRAKGTAVPWFELDLAGPDREAPVLEVFQPEIDLSKRPERLVVWSAMGSRSSVIFDLDEDGDLDLVTNEMNHYPMVLISNLSEKKPNLRYLKVKLVGTKSNRSAFGAVVELVLEGQQTLMKVKDGQTGYLSHSDFPLYFGLGTAKQIKRLSVRWPSGKKQILEGPIETNRTITITEEVEDLSASPRNNAAATASQENREIVPIVVKPGEDIQAALEKAAQDPKRKHVIVEAGTYRPGQKAQAMIWFNRRHEGITLEAKGPVTLTAANQKLADRSEKSFPAVVNHVVYFGDGLTRKTVLKGFKITGAKGFLSTSDAAANIQPEIAGENLERAKFFYTDGGGIKIFGRSYPTIENVEVSDNFTSPCGAGVSIEHRGHIDGSRLQSVLLRNCIFRGNICPISGAAVDLLHGSSAEIVNCLFIENLSNGPMDEQAKTPGKWKPRHGSGALTVFPESRVIVRRCTFTGNRNGVDDSNKGNIYEDSIFWNNTAPGGWPPGGRYELDLDSGVGVNGCYIGGNTEDLQNVIDRENNILECPDPKFDRKVVPQNPAFEGIGYRPAKS